MSDINLDFTVSNNSIQFVVESNEIAITPSDIQLNIGVAGGGYAAAPISSVQYNKDSLLAGSSGLTFNENTTTLTANNFIVSNTTNLGDVSNVTITGGSANYFMQTDGLGNLAWANLALGGVNTSVLFNDNLAFGGTSNLTFNKTTGNFTAPKIIASSLANLGNVGNVKITGGVNGYVLQTDGTGNLDWTVMSGGGGGNGTPGGSNTQIQYNDSGAFGGNAGFTFNEVTGNMNVPSNVSAIGYTGNILTPSQTNITSVGNLSGLTVSNSSGIVNLSNTANVTLGSVSNLHITGGSNGQILTTNGSGNISFANAGTSGQWSNVLNLQVNDLFFGTYYGSNSAVLPGSSVSVTPGNVNVNSWTISNSLIANNLLTLTSTTDYIVATVSGESNIARTQNSALWAKKTVPFALTGIVSTGNRIIALRSGANTSAYSDNNGDSWTYANNINTTLNLGPGAFGNGTIIISRSEISASNNFIKSNDYGVTWSNSNIGGTTYTFNNITYGNGKFIATRNGNANAIITTNNGNTWANISIGVSALWRQFAYGNGKWVGVSEYNGTPNTGKLTVSTDDGATWTTSNIANVRWATAQYCNGTFILGNADNANILVSTDAVTWTTINVASPANANTFNVGAGIAFNSKENLIVLAGGTPNVAGSLTPSIIVPSSDGNLSNAQSVPSGTYKTLGGGIGNVGAMWIRTA